MFTRNEECPTSYNTIGPISSKKADQYQCNHSTKHMKMGSISIMNFPTDPSIIPFVIKLDEIVHMRKYIITSL